MANYHLTTKSISRRSGKSCVASLAYRAASELVDQQTGETFNYTNKAFVEHVEILVPENAPQWIRDIAKECEISKQTALQKLSDKLEAAEKRCDARVYREIEFSLPRELTNQQNLEWTKSFIQKACLEKGMMAILNFHSDIDEKTGERKPHCHVLLSTRELTENGFNEHKQREWNKQEVLEEWRELCAQFQNQALAQHGHDVQVNHRSYADQGITEILPQSKRGKAVMQMAAQGKPSEKQARFDAVRLKNQFQIVKNPELIFKVVTSNHATFTKHDVARVLNRYIDDPQQYNLLYQRLVNSSELIHLKDGVFTTHTILRSEMDLVKTAELLTMKDTHKVLESVIDQAIAAQNEKLKKYGELSADQISAIRLMLSSSQISCVVGFAGAGKTTSLEAAKEALEISGYKVLGLAPTGRAVDNMTKSGVRSLTLHKFLWAHSQGRERISAKTVLVLDEAGMVDSRRFSELMALVKASGAKLVSIGDGNQLQAVEAGPAFRLLTHRIQPAVLETVIRQKTDWQREATSLFGAGKARAALELYQKNGVFKIITEREPNPEKALETYCLARQISGRIWKEMRTDPTLHKDYPLYKQWRDLRQALVAKIEENLADYKPELERLGFVQQDRFEDSLRSMSYGNSVDTRAETRTALVAAWAQDRTAHPEQTHLMLAFTNKDAASLNDAARGLMREQGQITGPNFMYKTERMETDDFDRETRTYEEKAFAAGDRLLFTRNDNRLGVKNGTLGTILELTRSKIAVQLDDAGAKISFAPKLYPFLDHGWATTIHKAQGVTVDHVKKLASFEEYRNLAYVGMTRHRHTLEVFASSHDFWRPEKIIDRLSRVQEKLSGLDYANCEKLYDQLNIDARVLWHEKKLQQGRDFLSAVKVTAQSVLGQVFGLLSEKKAMTLLAGAFRDNSEEHRSAELFKFRESISAERAKFEATNAPKFREVCEFFDFRDRFGRASTPEDMPILELMSRQLTQLAGRLFEERSLENHKFPEPLDICKLAYKAFAERFVQEKILASQLISEHGISRTVAAITASVILSDPAECNDKTAVNLSDIAVQRFKEISAETGGEPSEQSSSTVTSYRVARELGEMQTYTNRHGTSPTDSKLKEIQTAVKAESNLLEIKVQHDLQAMLKREQIIKHGMRM